MQKINRFKFSTSWVDNVSIFGYKMRLEKLNVKRQIGVKILDSYRNFKVTRQQILQMKFFNKKTILLKSFVALEIGSFFYFKLFKRTTENKFVNEIFNHEKNSDYIFNILILRFFGTLLCVKDPIKANLLLSISGFGIVPAISFLNQKLSKFMSDNYKIENFSLYMENNLFSKIVLCSALAKFMSYFISDKFWSMKYFTFNRKHIFTLISTYLLMRLTSFLSLFTTDNIK